MRNHHLSQAHERMTVPQMKELIRRSPPGGAPSEWAKWDVTRDAFLEIQDEFVEDLKHKPYPVGKHNGRGIVVSVNAKRGFSSGKWLDQGFFPGAYVLVKELRRLGCTLPVTFAHIGKSEWCPSLTPFVSPLGVEVLDLEEVSRTHRCRILAGWESKFYSVVHSPYEEVLFLDADNIPLHDPTFLFDSAQYRHYGSIFWPDVPPMDRKEWLPECVWRNVGLPYRDEVDFETGQFLINKKRCWQELLLAMHFNEHSDYYFKFIFGDKSTPHLSWAVFKSCWAIPQRLPGSTSASLLQHDFEGRHLFQHCTRNKPTLAGYPMPHDLLNRGVCEQHLRELASLWDGKIWSNPNPSVQEREIMHSFLGKPWTYEREGLDTRDMTFLLEDTLGRIGRGLAKKEVSWTVHSSAQATDLVLFGIDEEPTCILTKSKEKWLGRWLEHERCNTFLYHKEA